MSTPDPFLTQEQLVALAATILTSLITLFKLNITDAQRGALLALIGTAYVIFALVHAAIVRHGRAAALANRPVVPAELVTAPPDGNDQILGH